MAKSKSTRGRKPQSDESRPEPRIVPLLEHIEEQKERIGRLTALLFATKKQASAENIDLIVLAEELAGDIEDQLDRTVIARLLGVGVQS